MREWVISEEDLGCDGAYLSYDEVVRCKYCKYWQQARPNSGNCSMGFAPTAYADDFCSFGERSEDE